MVVAAATGVVLDVAAVVVVAHLNFGASKSINDCVHHLVVGVVKYKFSLSYFQKARIPKSNSKNSVENDC